MSQHAKVYRGVLRELSKAVCSAEQHSSPMPDPGPDYRP